ncbi:MAG: LamG domain-containing protein [Cyanobacteria bacterium P01_D01_bin.105]
MTIQPKFHWKFRDKSGATTTVDSISKVKASLFEAKPSGHGRIGRAMHLLEKKSHVNLGKAVGQFGTGDFTIAFGMKNISNHGDGELDIIGSQTMKGHGNFFSVRLSGKDRIFFHVDENSKGKHYVKVQTDPLSMVSDRTWFHVAVVRKGRTIQIYINGVLSIEEKSKTGVANIKNDTDVKLGHSRRHTPNAQYEDLRIYDHALNAKDIQDLIPSANRPLRAGEIELVAADGAAMILRKDVGHLSRFSQEFQTLRVGSDTAVALFNKAGFGGTSQLIYADLPDIKLSRLKDFPASVRIRSAIGNPFTGKWLIKAPNGEFLSQRDAVLSTARKRSFNELFKLQSSSKQSGSQSRQQVIHSAAKANTVLKVSPQEAATNLFVEELRPLSGEFAIVNQAKNQWLAMGEKNTFKWTDQEENRAVFARVAKMADRENQVGELAPGEVALYQHVAYHGRTWILSDTEKDRSGEYPNLSVFQSLQDETSSIRLGPETGMTVFREDKFRGSLEEQIVRPIGRPPIIVRREGKQSKAFRNIREKVKEAAEKAQEAAKASLVEDIVDNTPNLFDSQIGNDTISSLKIFRTVAPEDVFSSYTTKLSQDYKMVGDKLEEFSAYRTTLRFDPSDSQGARKIRVEVSATDSTKIEVEGTIYKINEQKSVVLRPDEMNRIMITSEADGLNTPGLKIHTSAMAANERVVIFPNQEAHQQIAELEEGALWNAKDAKGNFIVDREAHSREEVASVQNTIKRVMATVAYADETPESQASDSQSPAKRSSVARAQAVRVGVAPSQSSRSQSSRSRVKSLSRAVSGATIDQPWKIELGAAGNTNRLRSARSVARATGGVANEGVGAASPTENLQNLSASTPKTIIQETQISQDEFAQLLGRAIPEETSPKTPESKPTKPNLTGPAKFIKLPNPFPTIGDAIQSGASATIGFFEDAVNVLVDTAQGVFRFVVDTVEKVAEFVESVVEKVVKKIKQFIEFLQFLFDWDDILKTQRYLVGAVNAGLDYAALLADEAKPHVSNFFDGLQGKVEDGMNDLVEKLGGDPSEVKQSEVELPEALEWLLSKLFGGSKQSDAKTDPGTAAPDGDSPLEEFIRHFIEAVENLIGAGLRGLEGVGDSLLTLLKNPLKPQRALVVIIEALRDVVIQLLEAGENITLGLLSAIEGVIKLFKDVLNGEIKIPFISDLFKFIGAGKLTILNLFGLILAVPVTVVHKIVFNERPFKGDDPSELLTGPKAQITAASKAVSEATFNQGALTRSAVAEGAVTEEDVQTEALSSVPRLSVVRGLGVTALIANAINGFVLNPYLNVISESLDDPIESSTFRGGIELFSWLNDFFIWLPTIPGFLKVGTFKDASGPEKFLWVVRTFNLWSDLAVTMYGWTARKPRNTQRMKRADEGTIIFFGMMSIVDLMAAGLLVGTLDFDQQPLNMANQTLFVLPNLAVMLRLVDDPNAILLLLATDIGSAALSTVTGGVLLASDVDALKQATA